LAASARSNNSTIYILDTEGAAQNLVGKDGIHRDIQAIQTLSLKKLLDAMREVKRSGQAGDVVILDSISKVLQAMRSYAQQRAGAETDRKASLSYDEHASVNRNLQAIYTGLTELKHAGFHVVIIGHLAKKYKTNGNALADDGLRVLADEHITYEADAVLLVERTGDRRSIKPIIKLPRPRHLQLNQEYPAELATLYPEQAAEGVEVAPEHWPQEEASARAMSTTEAERRFYGRYAETIGGMHWRHVESFLGRRLSKPKTVEEWVQLANQVKAKKEALEQVPERLVGAYRS
jgi:hypothetical protein